MRIQHNISAINANRNLAGNNSKVSKSLEKLSSGYAINRAGDNAAGLAISEKMRAQIKCLDQAETNCNDGISLIQTAEGALTEVHDMLNRMVELAEQSANGTYDDSDRSNLQAEVSELQSEIDRIADATNFNGVTLLNGNLDGTAKAADATSAAATATIGASNNFGTPTVTFVTLNDSSAESLKTSQNEFADALKATGLTIEQTDTNDLSGAAPAKGKVDITMSGYTFEATATAGKFDVKDKSGTKIAEVDLTRGSNGAKKDTGVKATAITAATIKGTGKTDGALTLQIGESADSYNQLAVDIDSMKSKALGVDAVDISTQAGAQTAISAIKTAIDTVSTQRGTLGAWQNRLEHTVNNLSVTNENMTNAESRIRDTDMAKEMMKFTSKQILAQAAQSMLSQANQQPQQVLSLLQ